MKSNLKTFFKLLTLSYSVNNAESALSFLASIIIWNLIILSLIICFIK